LLGLIREEDGLGAQALRRLNLNLEGVCTETKVTLRTLLNEGVHRSDAKDMMDTISSQTTHILRSKLKENDEAK